MSYMFDGEPEFCGACGSTLLRTTTQFGFDRKTGQPIYAIRRDCPHWKRPDTLHDAFSKDPSRSDWYRYR